MKDFTHPKFPTIHIKLLSNTENSTELEALLEGSSSSSILDFVPEGSNLDAKYIYGIFDDASLIGVIDLIEDYPTKQGAFIHQFLLKEHASDELAETLYLALEKTVQETGITSLEISSELSEQAIWKTLGFVDNKKAI